MAKLTTTSEDFGLIDTATITANGSTTGIEVPAGRLIELSVSVPSGVTGTVRASFDGGATYPFVLTPTSLSVIDATAAAVGVTMQYYTEETGVRLRVDGAGTWGGGTLSFRVSGAVKR